MASCIPTAQGVPGQGMAGPPQWWDSSAGAPRPLWAETLDKPDPRWNGATRRTYNSGTAEEGVFRAVHNIEGGQPVLYLLWEIKQDPTFNAGTDAVFVGFQGASGVPHVFEIDAYSAATPVKAAVPADIVVWEKQASGRWTPAAGAEPSWTNTARAWLQSAGSPPKYRWSVQLRVPSMAAGDLDNTGINLSGASFRFFFAIIKDTAVGAVPYKWPRTVAAPYVDDATAEMIFPAVTGWDTVTLGSGSTCGAGISLDANDVGTTNVDPATGLPDQSVILASTAAPKTNHFFAKPKNATGAEIPANALKATFRTANWGSQTGWSLITAPGATPWEEILPAVDKKNAARIADGTKGSIEFDWTINTTEAADWIQPGGSKFYHQCMLVTLESVGQNYEFANDSVYRNMRFVKASTFNTQVEINVPRPAKRAGFGARFGLGAAQNVYIHVDQQNMPRVAPKGRPFRPIDFGPALKAGRLHDIEGLEGLEGPGDLIGGLRDIRIQPDRPRIAREPIDLGDGPLRPRDPVEPVDPPDPQAPEVSARPIEPPPTFDQLAETLTTVRYFVFRETGKRIIVGGKIRPLLDEQTSFGYFIQHNGTVLGFDHALGGPLAKVGPNIYKLAVTGASTRLYTKVVAYEKKLPLVRMAQVIPGPAAKIQPRIPVLRNFPGVGSVASRVTNVIRRTPR